MPGDRMSGRRSKKLPVCGEVTVHGGSVVSGVSGSGAAGGSAASASPRKRNSGKARGEVSQNLMIVKQGK